MPAEFSPVRHSPQTSTSLVNKRYSGHTIQDLTTQQKGDYSIAQFQCFYKNISLKS